MEVEEAFEASREGKAAGICGIPPELLKHGGIAIKKELTKVFIAIMEERTVPTKWVKLIILSMFKNKGSQLDYKNHRWTSEV